MPTLTHQPGSDRLSALIAAAADRARVSGRPVLLSIVERTGSIEPLDALERWADARPGDTGPRMYWSRPRRGTEMACIGSVAEVTTGGPGRFAEVRRAMQELIEPAIVEGVEAPLDGVGPMLVGGLSFDPTGSTAREWRDFPAAWFVLPRVQLATVGDERWMTVSMLVDADGASDVDPAGIEEFRDVMRAGAPRRVAPQFAVHFADEGSPGSWHELVTDAVRAIDAGEFDKAVLARSRRCRSDAPIDAHAVLRRLTASHPDCFVFGVWHGDSAFVGASPERLVRLDGRAVQASSLAGSAPRGATAPDDRAHAAALATSAKDLAEHALVREALVSALDTLCDDVDAAAAPSLFTLPHVHHLHTAVTATLRGGHSIVDLVEALHPTPAVGGAPREAALAYIRRHERLDRGWYAAPVGWMGRDGGEFAVGLRSAVINGAEALLFAGCGIVATSDPASEYAETLLKLRPMEDAITSAGMAPG